MQFKSSIILIFLVTSFLSCKQGVKEVTAAVTKAAVKNHPRDTIASKTTTRNWLRPPFKYWGIKNVNKLFDTNPIAKGATPTKLEEAPVTALKDLKIEQFDGKVYSFEEHLDSNRTDGFLVLHKGKIAYEKYFDNMTPSSSHNWFSMSKSLTGITADILASEGKIDMKKQVLDYLPELIGTAWEGATVEMVSDMLVGIQYSEVYNDPKSDAYKFAKISQFVDVPGPPSPFANMVEYFQSIKKGRDHDELFHYVSLNTELLGLIIKKVTGKNTSQIMSEKVWSKIGAEHDAYVVRNSAGDELVSAAINSTLRDAGRFGQMMLNDGFYNGQQIVPKAVVQHVKKGGSKEKFADSKRGKQFNNYSYTRQWWHTDKNAFFAKGLFGQWIYVDSDTELVVVKFTTSDVPTSTGYDWMNNTNLINEIVEHFAKG